MILQAPHSLIQTTILLPNPSFGDPQSLKDALVSKTARSGITRTHIKTTDRRLLSYTFNLTREKAEELKQFIISYAGEEIRITWKGEVWKALLSNDVIDFTPVSRGNYQQVRLDFEGVKLSG